MTSIKKRYVKPGCFIVILCLFSCQGKDGSERSKNEQVAEVNVHLVPSEELELPVVTILTEPKGIPVGAPIRHDRLKTERSNIQQKSSFIALDEDLLFNPGHPKYPSTFPILSKPKQANRPEDHPSTTNWKKTKGFALQLLEQDGLPEVNNNGLFQDKEGAIWGSSRWGGAWKYDGFQFSHYNEYTGLKDYSVVNMLFDSEGDIWFGMSTALAKFDGLNFTHYDGENEVSKNKPTKFIEDSLGNIWVGSIDGLYRLDKKQNTITHFTSENGLIQNEISSLLYDQTGRIWITYNQIGVSLLSAEKKDSTYSYRFKNYSSMKSVPNYNIQSIYEMRSGNIYVGTDREFIEMKGPQIHSNEPMEIIQYYSEGFDNHFTYSMTEDNLGRLWVGRNVNLAFIEFDDNHKPNFISYFDEKDGLATRNVSGIVMDRENQLWLSHFNAGITKLDLNQHFRSVLKDYGISGQVFGLLEDSFQNIWFSLNDQGIFCLRRPRNGAPEHILQYTSEQGLSGSVLFDMIQDARGNIWMSDKEQVSKMILSDDGIPALIYQYKPTPGFNSKQIFDLMEDDGGAIWLAENTLPLEDKKLLSIEGGVYKLEGQRLYYYGKEQGLLSSDTYSMCQDKQGNFWFHSLYYGITKWEPGPNQGLGQWIHYLSDDVMQNGNFGLSPHSSDGVLINGQGGPIQFSSTLETPKQQVIQWTQKEGLSNIDISSLVEDRNGDLWFAHKSGIAKKRKQPKHASENEAYIFDKYTNLDGYSSLVPTSMIQSRDQNIWFTTYDELIIFDPQHLVEKPKKLEVKLQKVLLDDEQIIHQENISPWAFLPQNLILSHFDNYLDFEYSSVEVDRPHKVEYRHMLEGYESKWSNASKQTKISFPNLPHGKYTLHISARIANGEWGQAMEYPFKIRPPWWATWWAYSVYFLFGMTLLYALYRVQLNRRLEKAEVNRLKELDSVKSELFTNITHEFRTPLTVISGMASQIEEDPDRWLGRGLSMIQGNSKRLLSLVNQMLDLSKLESGKTQLDMQQGDIVAYLKYISQSIHSFAETKNIHVHFYAEEDEVMMDFDPEKVQKIMVNLLSNAVKFTPSKGNIYVSVQKNAASPHLAENQDTPSIQIKIRDTGSGIAENDLPFIFDRFYQINPDNNQDNSFAGRGSGIGLALVKELVLMMKGEISVKSKLGRETEFTIDLPIQNEASKMAAIKIVDTSTIELKEMNASENKIVDSKKVEIISSSSSLKSTVLLVEDNPDVVAYIASCLQDHYDIQVGNDGQEGIDIAIENIPDLIITDVMMPIKDGFEVCATLKKDARTSHIPIIMLTAKADLQSKLAGLSTGADAYLSKPFNKKELLIRIENLLTIRKNLQTHFKSIIGLSATDLGEDDISTIPIIENEFISKAKEMIDLHMADSEYNVQAFCKDVGMSHSQLHRKMTALTGLSPNKFIRDVRLTKAKQFLQDPALNINSIAYDTGFSDPGYFSRVFKKEFGMTPAEWREGQ